MGLDRRHSRQRLMVATIGQATNAAHGKGSILLVTQFVNLGFDMKKLDSLKAAINQAGNAVHKSSTKKIFIQKKQQGRPGKAEKHFAQPAAALRLGSEQRGM